MSNAKLEIKAHASVQTCNVCRIGDVLCIWSTCFSWPICVACLRTIVDFGERVAKCDSAVDPRPIDRRCVS